MSTTIRLGGANDAAAVIALWQACNLTRPWNDPLADFNRALATSTSTVLLAEDAGAICGTAMTGFDGHRGWIYYLAVAPKVRGRGIARDLLSACEHWLADLGCPKVELMVREGNDAAGLYDRLGWELQNVRVYARSLNKD